MLKITEKTCLLNSQTSFLATKESQKSFEINNISLRI